MKQPGTTSKARALPDTTLRRLRNTPSYFFLVWRWFWWLYALIVIGKDFQILRDDAAYSIKKLAIVLLTITFLQTLAVTLYMPVLQIIVPRLPFINRLMAMQQRPPAEDEAPDLLTPLTKTSNPYWNIAILCGDVLICGLVMYYGGAITSNPPFGDGSLFYRYGFSTIYAAAFAYRYRGALAAAISYDLFAIFGMLVFPPGTVHYGKINIVDIAGSLMDGLIIAILASYVATLLAQYTRSKREQQANVRRQRALLKVNEIILREANNRPLLLQKVAEQLRQGGHFQRLVIVMINIANDADDHKQKEYKQLESYIEVSIPETDLPAVNHAYSEQVLRSKQLLASFELFKEALGADGRGIARLYLPFYLEGQIQMIIGVESWRQTPFDNKQEGFLMLAGTQLLLALDNIRLTEQMVQLAATAERGRIARELHDGIAQLTYMLSLNAETCAAQAQRIAEVSEEDAELITPLAQRLGKMVTISKQALWETRSYMFSLKPLMRGTTTLSQMLTNQLREFETISDMPVQLDIVGEEFVPGDDQRRNRHYAQIGTAVFRIVQEALTNAYKHAGATRLLVHLRYLPESICVEVSDDGKGLPTNVDTTEQNSERIYSGHGMRGMHERAEELGGTLQMTQAPAGGLQIEVQLPL